MESTTIPAATAGDVDEHGDVVGALLDRLHDPLKRRLRAACCAESDVDVDEHVARIAAVIDRIRGIGR